MLFKHSFHTVVTNGIWYTGNINCDNGKIYIKFAPFIKKITF
jgi:hypothetical protein